MSAAAAPARKHPTWGLLVAAGVCMAVALLILASAGLPSSSVVGLTADGEPIAPVPGLIAPSFTAVTADGDMISLDNLRGRPVLVNFWATWCGPCAVEMPELQRLHTVYGDRVVVLGVNTGESGETIRAWASERGLTFSLPMDETNAIATLYQLRGQPTTFVIGPDGRINDILYGATTFERLESLLSAYLT